MQRFVPEISGTHHKAAVLWVGGERHPESHLVLPLRDVVQREFPWEETRHDWTRERLKVLKHHYVHL